MSKRAVVLSAAASLIAGLSASTPAQAAFPGQNGQIVFAVSKYDKSAKDYGYVGQGALYTVFPDGSGATALPDDKGYNDFEPAWSPDGTRIAAAAVGGGKYDGIYVGAPGESEPKLVAKGSLVETPTWSADGRSVIYTDWKQGLLSVPADGSAAPRVLLSNPKGWETVGPSVSADGKTIIFARQKDTTSAKKFRSEIWAIDATGANPRRVVASGAAVGLPHLPDVSPDGSSMVFEGQGSDGASALFVAGIDGSSPRVLVSTKSPAFLTAPSWSPDGTKVVVSKLTPSIKKGSSLLMVDAKSGAVTTLRKAKKAYLLNPNWQPVPAAPTVG